MNEVDVTVKPTLNNVDVSNKTKKYLIHIHVTTHKLGTIAVHT
jgi:hypothetical protein